MEPFPGGNPKTCQSMILGAGFAHGWTPLSWSALPSRNTPNSSLLLAVLPHFLGFNAQFIKSIHISLKFKSINLNITTRTNQEITAPKTSPWELILSQSEIRISICFCRASSISSCSHQEIVTGLVFFALRETMLFLLSKLQGRVRKYEQL